MEKNIAFEIAEIYDEVESIETRLSFVKGSLLNLENHLREQEEPKHIVIQTTLANDNDLLQTIRKIANLPFEKRYKLIITEE